MTKPELLMHHSDGVIINSYIGTRKVRFTDSKGPYFIDDDPRPYKQFNVLSSAKLAGGFVDSLFASDKYPKMYALSTYRIRNKAWIVLYTLHPEEDNRDANSK
jgi:hypothetical protein